MYDAIVVGARCGGAPTAMLLARRGHRVLLVDRASFPSDTMSTHYVHPYGVARLRRWGVLERVLGTGCPPVTSFTSDWGQIRLRGKSLPYDGVDFGLCPRRYAIDTVLVRAAVEAGAELEERFNVTGLTRDGERVTGVRGRSQGGPEIEIGARVTVGADGIHSTVAGAVGATQYDVVPALTVNYYSYFGGLDLDGLMICRRPDRCVPAFPTNDGLAVVVACWHYDEYQAFRSDIEGNFYRTMDVVGEFGERVRAARRVERFVGTRHVPNFFRKPYGPGWALVGDAGYHKDPVSALGMSDAFRDAEYLADAIDEGLSGRRPLDEALAGYERSRYEAALPLYQLTIDQAKFEAPTPERLALLRALEHNPIERDRFISVLAGSVDPREFYAPENIGRILTEAGMAPVARGEAG